MTYDLTRRGFLAGTAATAAALALPQVARADMRAGRLELLKGSGKVVVSTWGGSYTDAQTKGMLAPFTKATGIEVVTTGTPDPAKLKLMEQSGNVEWDIVDAEGQMMYLAAQQGQLAPVDYDLVFKVVPKDELIPDTLDKYGVPSVQAFGWVLAWNTKTIPSEPAAELGRILEPSTNTKAAAPPMPSRSLCWRQRCWPPACRRTRCIPSTSTAASPCSTRSSRISTFGSPIPGSMTCCCRTARST